MAKTLIKIALALIVLHGAFRIGNAYWNFYRFEDALQEQAQFGDRRRKSSCATRRWTRPPTYGVPITAAEPDDPPGHQPAVQLSRAGHGGSQAGSLPQPSAQMSIDGIVRGPGAGAAGLLLPVGVQAGREGLGPVVGAAQATIRPLLTTALMAGAPTRIRSTASPSTMTASIRLPGSRLPTSASRPIA